jgi:farnesyl diphosphate synthase/geranylgeranyl diphosphate synthase type II
MHIFQSIDINYLNIGLAYQIQDDVLDVLTPEEILGKKQNSDADKNKPTYPVLLGLERSKSEFERLYQQAFNDLEALSVDTTQLRVLTLKLQNRKF